jgi:predicted DNA-binding protein
MTAMTTMKLPVEVRDRLARLARDHRRPLGAELAALVSAAEEREWWRIAEEAVGRLRADGDQWADYLADAAAWDAVTGDGLADAADEWPEFNPEPGR